MTIPSCMKPVCRPESGRSSVCNLDKSINRHQEVVVCCCCSLAAACFYRNDLHSRYSARSESDSISLSLPKRLRWKSHNFGRGLCAAKRARYRCAHILYYIDCVCVCVDSSRQSARTARNAEETHNEAAGTGQQRVKPKNESTSRLMSFSVMCGVVQLILCRHTAHTSSFTQHERGGMCVCVYVSALLCRRAQACFVKIHRVNSRKICAALPRTHVMRHVEFCYCFHARRGVSAPFFCLSSFFLLFKYAHEYAANGCRKSELSAVCVCECVHVFGRDFFILLFFFFSNNNNSSSSSPSRCRSRTHAREYTLAAPRSAK